jgi:hypothetical protein
MATKSKKTAARNARTSVKAKATRKYIRVVFDDNAKIRVIGEHNRRENSRYGKQYEMLRRVKTVGAFKAKKGQHEVLKAAVADKFVKVG